MLFETFNDSNCHFLSTYCVSDCAKYLTVIILRDTGYNRPPFYTGRNTQRNKPEVKQLQGPEVGQEAEQPGSVLNYRSVTSHPTGPPAQGEAGRVPGRHSCTGRSTTLPSRYEKEQAK